MIGSFKGKYLALIIGIFLIFISMSLFGDKLDNINNFNPNIMNEMKDRPSNKILSGNQFIPLSALPYYQFGFKVGYPFMFGYLGDNGSLKFPVYAALTYRTDLFSDEDWFYELEVGYFIINKEVTTENAGVYPLPSNKNDITQAMPITLSVGYEFNPTSWLFISPRLGGGVILALTTPSNTIEGRDNSTFLSSLLAGKIGLEVGFEIAQGWTIIIDNSFIIAHDLTGGGTGENKFDYFYFPTVGFNARF